MNTTRTAPCSALNELRWSSSRPVLVVKSNHPSLPCIGVELVPMHPGYTFFSPAPETKPRLTRLLA